MGKKQSRETRRRPLRLCRGQGTEAWSRAAHRDGEKEQNCVSRFLKIGTTVFADRLDVA